MTWGNEVPAPAADDGEAGPLMWLEEVMPPEVPLASMAAAAVDAEDAPPL
jgi:hypothetical protein